MQTIEIFDREIKRKRDLLLLKHAAAFPTVIKYWKKTQAAFSARGGYVEYKDPARQNIFQAPASAHYKEHYFDPYFHDTQDPAISVELARFAVPSGSIGVIRRLNQWVSGFSRLPNWGEPFHNMPFIDDIIWSLRLDTFDGAQAARLVAASPTLPGIPHSDLPEIRYLWYLPNADQSDLALIVPGGYVLRFIALLPPNASQSGYRVMGRLCGYWQSSEYKLEAAANLARGW